MEPFYAQTKEKADYNVPSESINTETANPSTTMMIAPQLNRSRNDGVVPDFIQKLFNMLESTDETSCYHWGRQGTTFVIDDTNEFSKNVLPRRFKHGNFSSFVRQLNKYDFHKIRFTDNKSISSVNQQAWEFQHSLFRRDRKHLLTQIRRKVNINRGHQTKQRQSINKSSSVSPSPSTTSSPSLQKNHSDDTTMTMIMNTNSTTTDMQHLHDNYSSLQAQIDQLTSDQQSMQSTLTRLLTTDTLLLDELHNLKRKMDEKDSLFTTILEQSKHQRLCHSTPQQHQNKFLPHPINESTIHTSTPMSLPQSPSLKLFPWLHSAPPPESSTLSSSSSSSSSPSSSSAPSYPLSFTSIFSTSHLQPTMTMLMDSTSSTPTMKIKQELVESPHQTSYPSTTIPPPLLSMPSMTLPSISTSSPSQLAQPLTLTSSPSSASSPSSSLSTTTTTTTLTKAAASNSLEKKRSPPGMTCHDWSHRPKVLVVEDNVMYRRISMRCLQRLGCDFDLACDGLEAVACMKTSQYDLILMDISIPKLDGMAATRKLRQYDQHTPVVSMTASYSDHDIENYVGSGMSDLLPKPFDQHKLYDILKQHCAHLV